MKTERLNLISEKIAACKKCKTLCDIRIKTVPGEGNVDAKLFIVGQNPGQEEDKYGRPFVGQSGKLLDNVLKICGMSREEAFIANVGKCITPGNRRPTPEESDNCWPFLDLQIKVVNPKVLLLLGSAAISRIYGKASVHEVRGTSFDYGRIKTFMTYHPSYILREPSDKQTFVDDVYKIKCYLDSISL